MPQGRRSGRTPPAVFDDAAWAEDMLRASVGARRVATEGRRRFSADGVPIDQLKPCDAEGRDGTQLPNCVKVYLPAPAGPHGMVFEIERIGGRLCLLYAAFGLRHPGRDMRQPSVYEVADRRLHDR